MTYSMIHKNNRLKTAGILGVLIFLFSLSIHAQQNNLTGKEENPCAIFPKGQPAPAENFTGKVWLERLVSNDSTFHFVSGSVTFEAGARSNWHSHPAGQILFVTNGICYYQEKGKPVQVFHKGDVVTCQPGIDHWHGASPSGNMTHIALNPNTQNGITTWKQPVTDAEYNGPKR
jgi:quercetin dioxygenase-like cupin family protein